MERGVFQQIMICIGIFLVSFAVISIEIYLNRMFSLTFWYHFAFLIISIALFGIGFGGMLVYFINRWVKKEIEIVLFVLSLALAVFIVWATTSVNSVPFEPSKLPEISYNGIKNSPETIAAQITNFTKLFLILSIPFVLGGMIFSFIFTNFNKKIHVIYFADLVGGGVGCLITLMIFPGKGPILMSVISGIFVLAASVFFIAARGKWFSLFAVIPILMSGYFMNTIYPELETVKVRVADQKNMKVQKDIFHYWDNFSYVVAQKEKLWIRLYGDYATTTPIIGMKNTKPMDRIGIFKNHLYPFMVIDQPENVCIVGAGGGKEIIMSLAFKSKHIDAVEFNPTFYYLLTEYFKEYSGNLTEQPEVNYILGEGRHFIQSSEKKYDVIIFNNAISQTAASSGAYTLSESYLYTVEAFMEYIKHLKEGGILSLSNPYPDAPRFVTVVREAFKRLGRENEFKDSFIASWEAKTNYKTCKIVIKNGAFTPKEIKKIDTYMQKYEHTPLYVPGKNIKSKIAGTLLSDLVLTENIENEYIKSDTEIRPSTDSWPFFTQRVKVEEMNETSNKGLKKVSYFYDQPFPMIRAMGKSAAKLCLLFMILPLLFLNLGGLRKVKNKIGSLIFFTALGMGFMFIEIVFMQKYILFLGHPIYAFSVVLASLLIASGVGSLISKLFENNPVKGILIALLGIFISVGINIGFFHYYADSLIGESFHFRVLISILLISLAGLNMGFMMPLGIQIISKYNESAIPWMWSVNGIFSVLSSFVSVYLSLSFGFDSVLLTGLGVYFVGALVFALPRLIRKN
ncbi:MAG: hypothetical protein A2Y41_00815 [Spirochaetes bacterium GWB1_36_13]|nr:MAG: hypothetical protein A2Y41_00815 [Spirochaetes bacterium GWB1_36_13]